MLQERLLPPRRRAGLQEDATSYADRVVRSSLFITADQLPRGMFSLVHLTAMYTLGMVSRCAARR